MIETKLAANVVAQVAMIKAVLPRMLERGDGTIVNVTSAVAITDPPAPAGEGGWGSAYAMSKGAFHRIAGIIAVEYRDRASGSSTCEPGYVVTERMEVNAKALGLEGRYPGAPPSVPAAVIAWCATVTRRRRAQRHHPRSAAGRQAPGPPPRLVALSARLLDGHGVRG